MTATGKRRRKLKRYRKPEDWADDAALEALARDYQRRIREASTQEIEAYAGVRSGKILLPLISPGGFSAVCAPSNQERVPFPFGAATVGRLSDKEEMGGTSGPQRLHWDLNYGYVWTW